MMYSTNILLSLISTIFKTINSSVDETRKTLALFNKDWNTYKTNWQKGFASNGFAGGVKSVFQSTKSVVSPEQIQMLRTWNNAVKHGCTNQETFNKIIANADHNTKMYFAGLNKGKGTLDGLKKAQNATKASTIGLTIAQTALNMAISMGLMAAISLAIKGFDKMINHAKRASEAADEAFEETSSKVQEQQEELKTLDELISKYKELKKDGTLDIEGRKEVKELQNDIADLVGTQARNLDLVNGKLDDEIKKLDEISAKEAKNAYETATANYNNSQRANQNATGDDSFLFVDGYAYTGKREKDAEKILKEYGFGNNVQSGGFFGNTLFVMDTFDNDMNMLEGAQEKADYLQSMIDVLEQNGQRATELYSGLISQRDKYLNYIDNQQGAANTLVSSWITYSQYSNEELSKITVDSVESFEAYRQKMIEAAKNDESVGKLLSDGTLSEKDLEVAVNDFMATSIEFSDWYKQWIGDVQGSTFDNKMTVSMSELKAASDNLKHLGTAFKELSDDGRISIETISEIESVVGESIINWEDYEQILLNAKVGSTELNQAMSDLTYTMLEAQFGSIDLSKATEDEKIAIENKISSVLEEIGVTNADAVAHDYLAASLVKAQIQTNILNGTLSTNIGTLQATAVQAGITEGSFKNLVAQIAIANTAQLGMEGVISTLIKVGYYASWAASEINRIGAVKQTSVYGQDYIATYDKDGNLMMVDKTFSAPEITIPTFNGGSGGGSGSGSDNTPDYEDPTDAIINRINLRAKELEQQEESIQNAIEIAELENDYKKQISLTNDLIAKRKDRLTELETANAGLHNEAEYQRNIHTFYNEDGTESDENLWFDSQGNATEYYNALLNKTNITKEEKDAIEDLFERLSKYKKAYAENTEEIVGLNKEILQDEEKVWDLRREEFDERLEESEYYIQHSKDFGWENGDNEIAARKRVLDWIQSDYYKSLIKDDEEYYKILEEHRLNYIEAQKEQFNKATDFASSYKDSQKTLLQSYFDVSNSVAEAQHEIDKELAASKTMHEWLDKKTQKLLFNQEDYNKLSKELIDIQSEADRLQKQYQYDLENSTLNTIEEITSQYEMQYETLMKSYEIAKADLEIAKKKQKLNNVLNERNVRMLVNGEWTWVANTQDVIDAQSELADAEYARKTNEAGLRQTESINELTAKQDHLGTIINEFEDGVIDLDEAVEKVKDIFNDLPDYIDNAFKKISKSSSGSSGGSVLSGGGSSGGGYSRGGSSSNLPAYNATATTPGGITTGVYIDANGKTQTSGLQPGTVVHTATGDYTIKGGTGGNYIVDDEYASGTKYTKSGNLLMGEDGAEMFIKNSGHLIPINQPTIGNFGAGGIVFNQNQMGNLRDWWDLSNINPSVYTHIIQHPVTQPSGDTNCNNIIINGMNIAKDFEGQQLIDAIQRYVATHKY